MNRVNPLNELYAAVPLDPVRAGMLRLQVLQENEYQTAAWEAPFPMTARTQQDMADNRHSVVQDGIMRITGRWLQDGVLYWETE